MIATPELEKHIINPKKQSQGTVIWMHGLGADNHDFDSLIPDLCGGDQLPLKFIFPNAPIRPVTINQHVPMRAWYDVFSLTDLNREDVAGVYQSQNAITQLIQEEMSDGVPSERIILSGFSQGGAMALFTGMRQQHKLAGIMGLSCYLPLIHEHPETLFPVNNQTPIFMAHGTHDMTLPLFVGKMGFNAIQNTHPNIEWREYTMQHEISPQETKDIHQWIKRILA